MDLLGTRQTKEQQVLYYLTLRYSFVCSHKKKMDFSSLILMIAQDRKKNVLLEPGGAIHGSFLPSFEDLQTETHCSAF